MGLLANLLVRTIPRLGAQAVSRWGRALRGAPVATKGTVVGRLQAAQQALGFKPCEILRTKAEINSSSRFLQEHGLMLNACDAKNWDLAHLLPRLGHGNLLDMGCQGSIVLDNALRLGLAGDKVGIDLAALPPRDGMRLIQGDLTRTGLPAQTFDYITCLSVIEHGVDAQAFVRECARLLKPGGRLFLTFDYWDPKIISDIRLFDLPWNLFCRDDVENLIRESAAAGMTLAAPMDWTQKDGVIHPGYWAPGPFAYTFGIVEFVKTSADNRSTTATDNRGGEVLIVNHDKPACGVYQFGRNLHAALQGQPGRYRFTLADCADAAAIEQAIRRVNPVAVIYNWHPATHPFVDKAFTRRMGSPAVPALGFFHEVTAADAEHAGDERFDAWICGDPTLATRNRFIFKSGRPLPAYRNTRTLPAITTIGSFGFGFTNKGFARLAALVNEQFDQAIIRLHIPFSAFFDPDGREAHARVEEARALITKPGIRIEASHELLSTGELLDFLAGNSLNAFLYDDMHRGIASTLDYALAVDRPLAISKSYMFRHVWAATPSILVEERTLPEILAAGTAPLAPFKNAWSGAALAREYETILDQVLARTAQLQT
jgi:SAM-dependent methyltransferase